MQEEENERERGEKEGYDKRGNQGKRRNHLG